MTGTNSNAYSDRDIAREVVMEFAPEEGELFDQIWGDLSLDPTLADMQAPTHDRVLHAGTVVETTMMSLIIIPLIIEMGKSAAGETGKKLVNLAIEYLQKLLSKRSAPAMDQATIDRIAKAVAERLVRKRR